MYFTDYCYTSFLLLIKHKAAIDGQYYSATTVNGHRQTQISETVSFALKDTVSTWSVRRSGFGVTSLTRSIRRQDD